MIHVHVLQFVEIGHGFYGCIRDLGVIEVPENVGNLNWGGDGWDELYMPSTSSLYRIRMKVSGNRLGYMK